MDARAPTPRRSAHAVGARILRNLKQTKRRCQRFPFPQVNSLPPRRDLTSGLSNQRLVLARVYQRAVVPPTVTPRRDRTQPTTGDSAERLGDSRDGHDRAIPHRLRSNPMGRYVHPPARDLRRSITDRKRFDRRAKANVAAALGRNSGSRDLESHVEARLRRPPAAYILGTPHIDYQIHTQSISQPTQPAQLLIHTGRHLDGRSAEEHPPTEMAGGISNARSLQHQSLRLRQSRPPPLRHHHVHRRARVERVLRADRILNAHHTKTRSKLTHHRHQIYAVTTGTQPNRIENPRNHADRGDRPHIQIHHRQDKLSAYFAGLVAVTTGVADRSRAITKRAIRIRATIRQQ
ncbi:hypothetical protein EDC02_7632 [Micromonospora sp. Llam0]|nr:hypothetical protein EDC02_7632 [Micromonospora sp. Llam0]